MGKAGPGRTRAVGYIRVSTDEQSTVGSSLEAQGAAIRAYCDLYAVDLVPVPQEGVYGPPGPFAMDAGWSASTLDRPALTAALAMLRSGEVDAVIVHKLDRLTRSVGDLADLLRNYFGKGRAALLSVSEQLDTRSAGGELVLNLLTSVSQWERRAIGERTSSVMRWMYSKGLYVGGRTRYGRRRNGPVLVDDQGEQAIILAARDLRARGLSLRAVGSRLESDGMRPRTGGRWSASQIARLVVVA